MVLHISIDGTDAEPITALLYEFYKSKKYRVRLTRRLDHRPVYDLERTYNLLNHEKALLYALDESLTYFMEDWEDYDIVFWQNSILSDYLYLTDNNGVTPYWLNQINKFLPKKDAYIYIKPDKPVDLGALIKNIKPLIILNDTGTIEGNLKEAIFKINNRFPHCDWCDHIYKKNKIHLKYCSRTCSQLANQKKTRDRVNRYNKKYRNVKSPHEKNMLGSSALLKSKPNDNFNKELKIIKKEKRRLGIN